MDILQFAHQNIFYGSVTLFSSFVAVSRCSKTSCCSLSLSPLLWEKKIIVSHILIPLLTILLVGRISAQFLYIRAFCEKSTILRECVDLCRSMNIRCGAICEINAEAKKLELLTF